MNSAEGYPLLGNYRKGQGQLFRTKPSEKEAQEPESGEEQPKHRKGRGACLRRKGGASSNVVGAFING